MDTVKTGRFIARCRKRAGLTQVQLGEKLGVTGKTVSRWENGNYMPDLSLFRPLADELGVTLEELFRGESLEEKETPVRTEPEKSCTEEKRQLDKKYFVYAAVIAAVFMVCYISYVYNDLQFTFRTPEECRNMAFSVFDNNDAQIIYRDRILNGQWYQICFYADDEKIAITVVEEYKNRYRLLPGTGTHYVRVSNPPAAAYMHLIYDNGGAGDDLYIMWNYTDEDISAVKIKDTTYKPIDLNNGYKIWFAPVNSWWLMNNIEYIYR